MYDSYSCNNNFRDCQIYLIFYLFYVENDKLLNLNFGEHYRIEFCLIKSKLLKNNKPTSGKLEIYECKMHVFVLQKDIAFSKEYLF